MFEALSELNLTQFTNIYNNNLSFQEIFSQLPLDYMQFVPIDNKNLRVDLRVGLAMIVIDIMRYVIFERATHVSLNFRKHRFKQRSFIRLGTLKELSHKSNLEFYRLKEVSFNSDCFIHLNVKNFGIVSSNTFDDYFFILVYLVLIYIKFLRAACLDQNLALTKKMPNQR